MWYKVNKRLIWTQQVRPSYLYRLSTDFRWKTLAQLQAEWWTWTTTFGSNIPSFSYWNNWFTCSWYWYWWIYVKLPFKITNQNKIFMKFSWYWRWNNRWFLSLSTTQYANLSTSNQHEISYNEPFWTRSNQDQWVSTAKNVNWTKYWWTYSLLRIINWTNWYFDCEFEIDLPNNTIKWTCNSPSVCAGTMSWTLNTEWFNSIVWCEYFLVWIANYIDSWWQEQNIYTAEITIQ